MLNLILKTMRVTTNKAVNAFLLNKPASFGNTVVTRYQFNVQLILFGNVIAKKDAEQPTFKISNAGWFSPTTKERLNGLPGVHISQIKGIWYLNGKIWNGSWITIEN